MSEAEREPAEAEEAAREAKADAAVEAETEAAPETEAKAEREPGKPKKKSSGGKSSGGKSKAKPGSVRAKLEGLLEEYGMVAFFVYFGIFFTVWAGFSVAIAAGASVDLGDGEVGAGTLGIIGAAYIPTKLTQPLRIGATLLLTPIVASLLKRLRLRK